MTAQETATLRELVRRYYQRHPAEYIENILGIKLTRKQKEICAALIEHKRVGVLASHGVGKSLLAAALLNWFFDCFMNSVALSTAPTATQVKDVVWKEVRRLRAGRPGLLPKAPRMEASADHFAQGFTAANAESFQGRHAEGGILIVFDESVGIKSAFYDAAEGMMIDEQCLWLLICNPTDPTSRMKEECDAGRLHIVNASALDHENVEAELKGEAPPIKGAVSLDYIRRALKAWCSKIREDERKSTDIEFPPESGEWYRPGPLFEGKVLGRWPSSSINNVWSEAHFNGCLERIEIDPSWLLEIGCDVARYGDDHTTIWARRGPCVLKCIAYNGQSTSITMGYIIEMIKELILPHENIKGIPIKIDDDGVGGGLVDQLEAEGWNVVPVNAGSIAFDPQTYKSRRSELWWATRERAEEMQIDLSRLDPENLAELRRDLLAVRYKMNGKGQRVIEDKDLLKKPDRLKRSPDWADGFNLAFAPAVKPGSTFDEW